MKKRTTIVIILFIILNYLMSACIPINGKYSPCHQPNTMWVSEDGKVVLYIDENGNGTGTVDINGTLYDFTWYERTTRMHEVMIRSTTLKDGELLHSAPDKFHELYGATYKSKDCFTITGLGDWIWKMEEDEEVRFNKVK